MKKVFLFLVLFLFLSSLALASDVGKRYSTDLIFDETDGDYSWLIVGTANDTSMSYNVSRFSYYTADYYMSYASGANGDSINMHIIVEQSLDGTNWVRIDSTGNTAALADSTYVVWKIDLTNPVKFIRFIADGGTGNDVSTGVDLYMRYFFQE